VAEETKGGTDGSVCGLLIATFASRRECARHIADQIIAGRGGFAVAVNAEKAVRCTEEPELRALLDRASLRYADGAGVVLALALKGVRSARIPGADLWLAVLEEISDSGLPVGIIGASASVLSATRCRLEGAFPRLRIALARNGYEEASDIVALTRDVLAVAPRLILVAMGTPRQEMLIETLRVAHPGGYYLGLGGSLDVFAGEKRRAPTWMQNAGLEWLYRLLSEPTRAARQVKLLRFLGLLATGRT
jgi:UDP-N-acetyl-D-mannosaminouronate:lipid I N-acetyl-D-mannosaminouronosyltransferase